MRLCTIWILCALLGACTGTLDESPNVLPDWERTDPDALQEPRDAALVDAFNATALPASYRFTSLTIGQLGSDVGGFITLFLQAQWSADINNYKMNLLFQLTPLEVGQGDFNLQFLSGVGESEETLCSHGPTASGIIAPTVEEGGFGFAFARANIYTEDNEGTPFNCSLDPDIGNGIPLQAVSGTTTVTADWEKIQGELIGCLSEAHGLGICSCIGDCVPGTIHPSCEGCPEGSAPLSEQLGNIVTTPTCTELLGEPAFDLRVTFVAERLNTSLDFCP